MHFKYTIYFLGILYIGKATFLDALFCGVLPLMIHEYEFLIRCHDGGMALDGPPMIKLSLQSSDTTPLKLLQAQTLQSSFINHYSLLD